MKNKRWQVALLASLSLGLAPFAPEPHVWGKLKWLLGGAEGMTAVDWFDLILHSSPWFWLLFESIIAVKERSS